MRLPETHAGRHAGERLAPVTASVKATPEPSPVLAEAIAAGRVRFRERFEAYRRQQAQARDEAAARAAAVAREAMRRQAETAVEAGLDRADVAALDLAADGVDASDATKAIARLGREAVLARMDFAQWFAEAVVECRYGQPRVVPVKVAFLEGSAATWSLSGKLTLSLPREAFWEGLFGRHSFELLLHEMAHHEAFHHGRSFPKEVEAYARAAAEVMLARASEARRLFPELLSASRSLP